MLELARANELRGIFKRHGAHLPEQRMWDMLLAVDELLAQPVLRQMHAELLKEDVLHSDETPVTLRLEDGKGSRTGYAWGWRNLRGKGPSFDDVVQTNGIVGAGCWAHARRKLKKALDLGARNAAYVLAPIQRLFAVERALALRCEAGDGGREQLVALRKRVRQERSARIVATSFARADELSRARSTLPKSQLGKALGYLDRQRAPLSIFLTDPRIPIHNSDEERDLRHLVVGRNNWLVFASERGGQVAWRLYSLVLSCKQAGVDPELCIEDLLGRLSTTKAADIASLTPWAWAAARG